MKGRLKILIVVTIVFIGAFSRLIPHPPNFTAIAGLTLFGAAMLSRKWLALVVTFLALWLSDLFLNNVVYARMYPEHYEGFVLLGPGFEFVYLGFALVFFIGLLLLKKIKPHRLLGASLLSSLVFFLVTNFGVWLGGVMYVKTWSGLVACYTAGLPFFLNTLLGDLFYVTVFFGSYYLVSKRAGVPVRI